MMSASIGKNVGQLLFITGGYVKLYNCCKNFWGSFKDIKHTSNLITHILPKKSMFTETL